MNIEVTYEKILEGIKAGHRSLVRFTTNESEELLLHFKEAISNQNFKELEKILCLVEHSSGLLQLFERPILDCLGLKLPDNLIIFSLNCARKHIIQARAQKGHRLDYEFLEVLKRLLHSNSPEVVEWTLRTIEECGNQGVYFLKEFDKIKPAPWKWFNPHQRAVREIIALLERRWSRFEKH